MGGAVSAGQNNDELIDNLVDAEYIKSSHIEKVFRGVDRADYYLPDHKDTAYKDLAWKNGNIHLSAPCIYAEVMESLKLERGQSFLNLGSGTGYLSTLCGLVLGPSGVNHGVEYHTDVIDYARDRLEHFKKTADAIDEYDFAEPVFTQGNCLLINSGCFLYDRVYCGASCPPDHENYMKNLIKIGGILVMPLEDHLLQITRTGETTWETRSVLPVSFATLIPVNGDKNCVNIELSEIHVMTLQEICRLGVRAILRSNIKIENPKIDHVKKPPKRMKQPREKRRRINMVPMNMGMMLLSSLHDSESEDDGMLQHSEDSSRDSDGSGGSSGQARSSEDHAADFILQQMQIRAMQRRFMDMPRRERLERLQEQDDDDDDQGIEEDEDEDEMDEAVARASRKKPKSRRAVPENGIMSVDVEGGEDLAAEDSDVSIPDIFGERSQTPEEEEPNCEKEKHSTPLKCGSSISSGEEVEMNTIPIPTRVIPITDTSERRRYSSSASMSTSITSGIGTCSSIEEPADMDSISHELETHTEEPLTETATLSSEQKHTEDKLSRSDYRSLDTHETNQESNGAKNGCSHNPFQDYSAIDEELAFTSLKNGASKSVSEDCDSAKTEELSGCDGDKEGEPIPSVVGLFSNPPKVSIDDATPVTEEEEDEGDVDDIDMERSKDDGVTVENEVCDPNLTYRKCMREKVEALPIPPALKHYLLFYRT